MAVMENARRENEVTVWSACPAEGPGSWGFEGPEVIKLGVNRSTGAFAAEIAGTSSIRGTGTTSVESAGVYSVEGAGSKSWRFKGPCK